MFISAACRNKQFNYGAAAGPPSSPPMTNIMWWLKSDTGLFQDSAGTTPATADADPVGKWADQSGNGLDWIQATSAARPTLKLSIIGSHPVVRADATDDQLTQATSKTLKPVMIAAVLRHRSAGSVNTILGPTVGGQNKLIYRLYASAADKPELVCSNVANIGNATGALSVNTAYIIGASYSGAGAYVFYKNGAADGAATNNTTINSNAYSLFTDQSFFGSIDLAEFVAYSAVLDSTDTDTLFAYLNGRYSIY